MSTDIVQENAINDTQMPNEEKIKSAKGDKESTLTTLEHQAIGYLTRILYSYRTLHHQREPPQDTVKLSTISIHRYYCGSLEVLWVSFVAKV